MRLGTKTMVVLGFSLVLGGSTERSVRDLPTLGQSWQFEQPTTVAKQMPVRWQVGVRMGMFKRVTPLQFGSRSKGI
ncbi:hypothetical protein [Lactiplantibacillus mudanjiangensis]|uniref:Uncharacterized protein n=1 Tax=Lactiplantibacillus mudanjiangensis TaxID=1296538 RepID=A0A660E3T7_9LACO|nr:hypothetical protein [Lactiplantibacillus mudanjiangensis]VDG23549.1 hypothetical protein MUDAN_IGPPGNFN_02106 [Lactiplantibacillus mudanjiangensis]VDG28782.1 hypothetical protein MUDAN_MDHGFNIF_03181 [Lactiplantibacillus mudanjiangensis]VDG32202.1 hypothetical protein MUDAN_DOGOELCO_01494 [Lactiplantibacillus mudanjiangensis]